MFTSKIMTLAGGLAVCFLFPLSCNISTCPATIHYSRIYCILSWLSFPRHYSGCQTDIKSLLSFALKGIYYIHTKIWHISKIQKSMKSYLNFNMEIDPFFYYGFIEIEIELTNWITEIFLQFHVNFDKWYYIMSLGLAFRFFKR